MHEAVGPEFDENGICYLEGRDGHPVSLSRETWEAKLVAKRERAWLPLNWDKVCLTVREPDFVLQNKSFGHYHDHYRFFDEVQMGAYTFGTYLMVILDTRRDAIVTIYDRGSRLASRDLQSRTVLWRRT